MARLGAIAVVALTGALVVGSPARAASQGCAGPVRDLRAALTELNPTSATAAPGSAEAEQIRRESITAFATAARLHPECKDAFTTLGAQLQAEARSKSVEEGTPFLGPIGWLWNNVYYRVFSGNDVMMILFGWGLLLSPVILVVALTWVLHGAREGFRKPYVPEHLRVDT